MRRAFGDFTIGIAQLLFVAFVIFVLVNASPGDPAAQLAGQNATIERIEEVRQELGLNDHVAIQFGRWLGDAVQADLGNSIVTGEAITSVLGRTIPPTLSLVALALVISIMISVVTATVSALRPHGWVDRSVTAITSVGLAVPGFFIALVLVAWLAVQNRIFPAVGYVSLLDDPGGWLRHLILPSIALSTVAIAEITRQLRGSLVDVLGSEYVLSARARGVPTVALVLRHALKNALVPVMAVLGVRVSQMVGGTVIIESIFNISGLGRAVVNGALNGDLPVVLGITMFVTILVLAMNVVIDVIHPVLSPRIRDEKAAV